jgi:hypothetical protein
MKLERILNAALSDMVRGHEQPHCGIAAKNIDGVEWASNYCEPGYGNPKRGVVLANWNEWPSRLDTILEHAGYSIEWEDEWATCCQCYGMVRTSPDSYGWKASYVIFDDCELVCKDCALSDNGRYQEHLLNNSRRADTFDVDWTQDGFVKLNAEPYESGFHPGQNDKPQDLVKLVPSDCDYIFAIPSVGQFDITFDCWIRKKEPLS